MATRSSMRRWWGLTALAVGVAVPLAVHAWTSRSAAWRERLSNAAGDDAADVAEQVAALGDRGLALLVAALDAPRPNVAAAAADALLAELGRWQRLAPAKARAKANLLGAELADNVEHFGSAGRAAAADVAMEMLLRHGTDPAARQDRLVAHCECVLRAAGPTRRVDDGDHATAESRPLTMPPVPPLARADRRTIPSASPRSFQADDAAPLESEARAERMLEYTDEADDGSRTVLTAAHIPVNSLEAVDAVELFAQLHSPKAENAARQELQARGFTAEEIDLGVHLTSSIADERRRWAATLARSGGGGARQWFEWLENDADDEVRQIAVTWLATHQ